MGKLEYVVKSEQLERKSGMGRQREIILDSKAAEQAKHLLKKQLRSVHVIECQYTWQPTSPSRRNIGIRNLGSKCARL